MSRFPEHQGFLVIRLVNQYLQRLSIMDNTITSQMSKSCSSSASPLIIQASFSEQKRMEMAAESVESGESSLSYCEICVEEKENDQMFKIKSCIHSFCSDCISKHVATKILDNIITVNCPGLNCKSVLEFEACKPVIPKQVIEIWEKALCEELIDVSQRFYCPFKDCSALVVNDNGGGEIIGESECPFCHRLFCAVCYVPWHNGVECQEFQSLHADERGRDDLLLKELATQQKWSRCPQCKFYVERTEGCSKITCRCNFQFCYECKTEWNTSHDRCHKQ